MVHDQAHPGFVNDRTKDGIDNHDGEYQCVKANHHIQIVIKNQFSSTSFLIENGSILVK